MIFIVAMVVAGSLLIVAEVLFPSFGVLSLCACACFLAGVLNAFKLGDTIGYSVLASICVAVPFAIKGGFVVLEKTSIGSRLVMKPQRLASPGAAAEGGLDSLVGLHGRAETAMRPAGIVLIGGRRVDAVSDGSFIKEGAPITVRFVEGNRVVVIEEPPKARSVDTA